MKLLRSILFAILFAFSGGCAAHLPAAAAPPIINWSHFDDAGLVKWQLAAGRELGRLPVIFACHSGPDSHGDWFAYPSIDAPDVPVAAVARLLRNAFPGTPIVLLACNEGHCRLEVANVYYPDAKVWTSPGRDWRYEWNDWAIGHFDEFLQGKVKPHAKENH